MYKIEDIINKVHCADCLEFMKEMPDESVDLIITDPPYGVDYDGGSNNHREKLIGDKDTSLYIKIIPELYRITRKGGGGIYLFYTSSLSHLILPHLDKMNYQILIWYKKHFSFNMGAKFKNSYEPILYLKKPPFKFRGGNNQKDVFVYSKNSVNLFHPTQKPLSLIENLVFLSSDENDIVFDPFLGSGTTAVAAKLLKRNFIGIEISPEYCEIARKRIQVQTMPLL